MSIYFPAAQSHLCPIWRVAVWTLMAAQPPSISGRLLGARGRSDDGSAILWDLASTPGV